MTDEGIVYPILGASGTTSSAISIRLDEKRQNEKLEPACPVGSDVETLPDPPASIIFDEGGIQAWMAILGACVLFLPLTRPRIFAHNPD